MARPKSDEQHKPWTLKNVPADQRNAIIKAADAEGMDVGRWAARVMYERAQQVLTGKGAVVVHQPAAVPAVNGSLAPVDSGSTEDAAIVASVLRTKLAVLREAAEIGAELAMIPADGPGASFQKKALAELRKAILA